MHSIRLATFAEGANKDIRVKGFWRRGAGLVKSHTRKVKPKRKLLNKSKPTKKGISTGNKVALGIAGLIGIPIATYTALKTRHIIRLKNIAKGLVKQKPATYYKENLVIGIGGFTPEGSQSGDITKMMREVLGKPANTSFIPFDHNFRPKPSNRGGIREFYDMAEALVKQAVTSDLKEAKQLAQQVYSQVSTGQVKKVTLVGFSAGSTIGKDVAYILKSKGVDINLVTLGAPDFRFTPAIKNSLNINSAKDFTYKLRSANTTRVDSVKGHSYDYYLEDKTVQKHIINYINRN